MNTIKLFFLFFIATSYNLLLSQDIEVLKNEHSNLGKQLTAELQTKEAQNYKFLENKRTIRDGLVKIYIRIKNPQCKTLFRYAAHYFLRICEDTELDFLNSNLVNKKKLARYLFLHKVIEMK